MADPLIFVRGVHFAATVLACGTVGFIALVAQPVSKAPIDFSPLRDRLIGLIWLALAVAILSGAVWLVLFAGDITGATEQIPAIDETARQQSGDAEHANEREPARRAWPVLFDTRFGLVCCARLALAILLALLMLRPAMRTFQLGTAAALSSCPHWSVTPELRLALPETFILSQTWRTCLRPDCGSAACRRLSSP